MSENTAPFDFRRSFHNSNSAELDDFGYVYNIIALSGVALVIFGTLQGACNLDLMREVIELLESLLLRTEDIANRLREFLGSRMQYNTIERKLEAKSGRRDSETLISVDKIMELHVYGADSYYDLQGDIVALSLAYFNFENTIRRENDLANQALVVLKDNKLFFSLLYVLQSQFDKSRCNFRDEAIYLLPFKGSGIENYTYRSLSNVHGLLHFTLTVDQNVSDNMRVTCLECLNAVANATEAYQFTIESKSITSIPRATLPATPDDRCNSVKENFKEYSYIALFVIAAAASLAGGAIALTTYFHIGTSLMLAAGFIPFLNFISGFQISLLLGVVSFATACVGVCVIVKERAKCCNQCCKEKESDGGSDTVDQLLFANDTLNESQTFDGEGNPNDGSVGGSEAFDNPGDPDDWSDPLVQPQTDSFGDSDDVS